MFAKDTFRHNFDIVTAPLNDDSLFRASTDPATERYIVMQGQRNGKVELQLLSVTFSVESN